MVELSDAEIAAANERGRIILETQPHAASARYDAKSKRIIVDLTNGATLAFPPHLVQGLEDATTAHQAEVEVIGARFGLHRETATWMASRAARTASPAEDAAACANVSNVGRPRKAR